MGELNPPPTPIRDAVKLRENPKILNNGYQTDIEKCWWQRIKLW